MATITFYLREGKKETGELVIRYRDGKTDLKVRSGVTVIREQWSSKKQAFRRGLGIDQTSVTNKMLDELRAKINEEFINLLNDGVSPTTQDLRDAVDTYHGRTIRRKGRKNETLTEYMDRFIEDVRSGERLVLKNQQPERYKSSTIKSMVTFVTQFKEYQRDNKPVTFANVGMNFYSQYVTYFEKRGLAPNTIGRYLKHLKTIIRAAKDDGLHNHSLIDNKAFKTIRVHVPTIYLTTDEIKRIEAINLDPYYKDCAIARDAFLALYYTAQRISDYPQIKEGNIRTLQSGNQVLDFSQVKTMARVIVPVGHELAKLFAKYGGKLPKAYSQMVNNKIKEVASLAGIKDPINIKTKDATTGMTIFKAVPKCDLIVTHTARRSACTNMYLAGIPIKEACKISGHTTAKQFEDYIKIGAEETADRLATHEYFRGTIMKVAN